VMFIGQCDKCATAAVDSEVVKKDIQTPGY